jgi:hypothetical protein
MVQLDFTTVVVLLTITFFYLIPTLLAWGRRHRNALAITAVNLIFGWSIIGWGVALVWSLTRSAPDGHPWS